MIVWTGEQARQRAEILATERPMYADPAIYDYDVRGGAVLIRMRDAQCVYIKSYGDKHIAIQGTAEEFSEMGDCLGLLKKREMEDIKECVKVLHLTA